MLEPFGGFRILFWRAEGEYSHIRISTSFGLYLSLELVDGERCLRVLSPCCTAPWWLPDTELGTLSFQCSRCGTERVGYTRPPQKSFTKLSELDEWLAILVEEATDPLLAALILPELQERIGAIYDDLKRDLPLSRFAFLHSQDESIVAEVQAILVRYSGEVLA